MPKTEEHSQNMENNVEQDSPKQESNIEQHSQNMENNIEQHSLNMENNIEQHSQNLENDTQDRKQITKGQEGDGLNSSHSRSMLNTLDSRKLRIRKELGIPLKQDFDDSEYENGWRKYGLRDKSARKQLKQSLVEDSVPLKKRVRDTYEELESYDCDVCRKGFDSKTGLLNHMRMHQTVTKFTCILCAEIFMSNKELIEHKVIHKDEGRNFLCKQCPQAYTDHCDYLQHELSHQIRSNYKCAECDKYYTCKSYMALHIQTHFDRTTECGVCHRTIKSAGFNNHMATHTKPPEICVECGKAVIGKKALDAHMAQHTGLKLLQCYYCGRGFTTGQARSNHMRLHTNEKPYECKVCHSWFTQSSTRDKHMLTHETEKRYECEICGKKFFHKLSYTNHSSVHSNTQRYSCKLCNKPISTYTGLKTHMLYKHSDERNVLCGICNMAFKDQVSLNRHNKSKEHRRKEYALKINKTDK